MSALFDNDMKSGKFCGIVWQSRFQPSLKLFEVHTRDGSEQET